MNSKYKNLPGFLSRLLEVFTHEEDLIHLRGDYVEIYNEIRHNRGALLAILWLIKQIFKSAFLYFSNTIYKGLIMFKNYLKIAFRNIKRHKSYSLINISGLTIGSMCCLLIFLYLFDELSYDAFHEKGDRIYRILTFSTVSGVERQIAISPPGLIPEISRAIPDIESSLRMTRPMPIRISYNNRVFEVPDAFGADSTFFNIFTHEFVKGDPSTALNDPNSIVITEETEELIFGEENPLEKTVTMAAGNREISFIVKGVIKDLPRNSHFDFRLLISYNTFTRMNPVYYNTYDYVNVYSYLLLNENADPGDVKSKIMSAVKNRWGDTLEQRGMYRDYQLQKLNDIYLKSDYEYDTGDRGNIVYVYLFSTVAAFVLFIACFNFINLSTARSTSRAKEVCVRKVCGAHKKQLLKQYIVESILLSFVGLTLGILLVMAILPFFNSFTGKEFDPGNLVNLNILTGVMIIIIITGIVAGSFPAFILSSFNPVKVMKGKYTGGSNRNLIRKILVISQFSISIYLIINTLVITDQLNFLKNKDLGFDKGQLVVFRSGLRIAAGLKDRLMQNPDIKSVSPSFQVPGQVIPYRVYTVEGRSEDDTAHISEFRVGYDFIKTYDMNIIYGRDFSKEMVTDSAQAVIVNEKAVEYFGWGENSLGKTIADVIERRPLKIIGIVRDFHHKDLKFEINPTILRLEPGIGTFLTVRLNPVNIHETIEYIENICKEIDPDRNVEYYFLDDDFASKYQSEDKVRTIYYYFGFLGIFIACLGLYGLVSFTVEQYTKDIGIRKVFGASVWKIAKKFFSEYVFWIIIANIISLPVSWYLSQNWLSNFAYKISISIDYFIVPGVMIFVLTILTAGYKVIKAALANPVDSLRYE
ncbi:ABC transporter permease [candidate division KSB1 bacterium]